jgi:uncharacterized membrane protein
MRKSISLLFLLVMLLANSGCYAGFFDEQKDMAQSTKTLILVLGIFCILFALIMGILTITKAKEKHQSDVGGIIALLFLLVGAICIG